MHLLRSICSIGLAAATLVLAGCTGSVSVPQGVTTSTTKTTTTGTTTGTTTEAGPAASSIYLNQASTAPYSQTTLLVPAAGSGVLTPTLTARGTVPSLDVSGNLYTLSWGSTSGTIDEYAVNNLTGSPVRTLLTGSAFKLKSIVDVMASPTGEIFASDGAGVAVYNPAASGDATPDRYISGVIQTASGSTPIIPGMITVDSSDNLFVANTADNASIAVYGPTANGTVAPSRVISGALTDMNPGYISGMSVDATGNLYVLCSCTLSPGSYHFVVLKFAAGATGNVAPTQVLYSDAQNPYAQFGDGEGMALGTDGTLYIASAEDVPSSVYVYAPGASNHDAPVSIITSPGWTDIGWSVGSARIAVR